MNVFHSPEGVAFTIGFVTELQNERHHIVETFGSFDFFNPNLRRVVYPGEAGYLLVYQQLKALSPKELVDDLIIRNIKLTETNDWQLFEYTSILPGQLHSYYANRYVVYIFDDVMAVQYKLKYK
jgi:hypothetical protein